MHPHSSHELRRLEATINALVGEVNLAQWADDAAVRVRVRRPIDHDRMTVGAFQRVKALKAKKVRLETWLSDSSQRVQAFAQKAIHDFEQLIASETRRPMRCSPAAGFAMLRPKGMDAQVGPFSDVTALRAVLEEMGMLAVQAGFAFCVYLDTTTPLGSGTAKRFLVGAMDFSGKYLGRMYSPAERKDVERLFVTVDDFAALAYPLEGRYSHPRRTN